MSGLHIRTASVERSLKAFGFHAHKVGDQCGSFKRAAVSETGHCCSARIHIEERVQADALSP
jgi:hypothetical protein